MLAAIAEIGWCLKKFLAQGAKAQSKKDLEFFSAFVQERLSRRVAVEMKENIERNPEELMQEAASDELFLADLNETMGDFDHADHEDHEILTMDCLTG